MKELTEAEAMTKWCPFVRVTRGHELGQFMVNRVMVNRGNAGSPQILFVGCLGAHCMAWVESEFKTQNDQGQLEPRGHCGLVRK